MKKVLVFLSCFFFLLVNTPATYAQQKIFHRVTPFPFSNIMDITQDREGYIWLTGSDLGHGWGLFRYDGSEFTYYAPDSSNWQPRQLCIDSSGMIWIGTNGSGLYRFNQVSRTFTRFRHSTKNASSLTSDSVGRLLVDYAGNLWIGTVEGLNMLRHNTGKFIHFKPKPGDTTSLSSNWVTKLYQDPEGNLWVGSLSRSGGTGGLNLFHPSTGTFTHYLPDLGDPQSPENNITAIYEDSKGILWLGTFGNRLLTLNRKTGVFTRYPYEPDYSEKLGSLPLRKGQSNFITFITGDVKGNLWIGSFGEGIQEYDPQTGKVTHYGWLVFPSGKSIADTAGGFNDAYFLSAFKDENGLLWISGGSGNLSYINPFRENENIPYDSTKQAYVNAFYKDKKGALWLATDDGLLYKPVQGKEKLYIHKPYDPNSLAITGISTMTADKEGNLWFGTYNPPAQNKVNVLDKFNPATGKFTHYTGSGKLTGTRIFNLCFDDNEHFLWIAGRGGLFEMNTKTGGITHHYQHHNKDNNSISNNNVNYVTVYGQYLWAANDGGLDRLDKKSGRWKHYLSNQGVFCVYKDAESVLWAGTPNGLFRYNATQDRFHRYQDSATGFSPQGISNIQEDKRHNLWVTGTNAIYHINANRNTLYIYGPQYGVNLNILSGAINYQAKNGKLYMGNTSGYYSFYPDKLNIKFIPPVLHITGFQLGNKDVIPGPKSPLKEPLFQTKEIRLGHKQNTFSFDFEALHFGDPGAEHYRYMLGGYDNRWHDIGGRHKAYFFYMPPGNYTFKVRAVNPNGAWSERDIAVVITPPWWSTWWAILIFILLLAAIIWGIVYYRSRQLRRENNILEEKVNHRTRQLKQSLEDLKSAQKQLIQSEKMASLGELTAGIAHEIQNPLNFVNNFSEVSVELIEEMTEDIDKGRLDEVKLIANDLSQNLQKISFHGKRAEAIVKGMLQHSRGSSGHKEPTDINALADEYLRLSYHGLRARDKSFNATMKTDFDETIGKINVVPQDIGRVLLNLYNNAFYACTQKNQMLKAEKQKLKMEKNGYDPTVVVTTKKCDGKIAISVKDNGNGISQKTLDKIFQPFFTTKPTGEGTGLGLSLSYEIIKVHNGEIKVNTTEGEGTEFIVMLPES